MEALPLYVEVHVDDEVLSREPGVWSEAAALLDALGKRAEDAGGALCFRIREDFARGDRSGFLVGLQARGHEIGWHAHGARLDHAVRALRATGVAAPALVGAPGLVQVELRRGLPGGRLSHRVNSWLQRASARRLLETAWGLGLRVLTDRRQIREFGWQGKLPWGIDLGGGREILSLDVTADPFAWGVLRRTPDRVHHARGTLDWDALEDLVVRRERESEPRGYFGLALHEHNFCARGSLRALPTALDAFSRWVDRRGPALRPAASLTEGAIRPMAKPDRPTLRLPRRRPGPTRSGLSTAQERLIPVAGRSVKSLWLPAANPRGIVVAVHGGAGGCTQRLGFLGLPDDALAREGWTLVVFDRTEGVARTPGNPVHVADTAAVLDAALAEARARRLPLHVLTWSGGLVPAVHSGLVGVARLVDVEGPVDRYSLVPPGKPDHELTRAEVFDEAAWQGRESLAGISRFTASGGDYVRVQGRPDHVHGEVDLHALAAIQAANGGRAGSASLIAVAGPVGRHGGRCLAAVVS